MKVVTAYERGKRDLWCSNCGTVIIEALVILPVEDPNRDVHSYICLGCAYDVVDALEAAVKALTTEEGEHEGC
jgi:hypothetical protein